ncbi:GFA family protein [Rhizobium sp. PL01]|uniref:GFA family protein n=1 Tax=Rhizobium sp. PL01 TaxID=3085631 RepID=UPI002982185E|nr:GFA family protein [Rhizobium sp. PL01]MDW5315559.1 GFA family protein [Rhizobium sp. PL01]
MPGTPTALTGKCLCGAIEYAVEDSFDYAMNCHCSNCRRTTGSAFKPIAGIKSERLRLVRGENDRLIYGSLDEAHDVHCGICGSLVYSVVRDGAYAHVPMGTLVDAPSIRPAAHIFTGSKAPWYEITDDLPQYYEFPGE